MSVSPTVRNILIAIVLLVGIFCAIYFPIINSSRNSSGSSHKNTKPDCQDPKPISGPYRFDYEETPDTPSTHYCQIFDPPSNNTTDINGITVNCYNDNNALNGKIDSWSCPPESTNCEVTGEGIPESVPTPCPSDKPYLWPNSPVPTDSTRDEYLEDYKNWQCCPSTT